MGSLGRIVYFSSVSVWQQKNKHVVPYNQNIKKNGNYVGSLVPKQEQIEKRDKVGVELEMKKKVLLGGKGVREYVEMIVHASLYTERMDGKRKK